MMAFTKLNIDKDLSEQEIFEVLDKNNDYFEKEIDRICRRIRKENNHQEVLKDIKATIKNKNFYDIIEKEINYILAPFNECEFIRRMDYDKFKDLVDYSIDNIIINVEEKKEICKKQELSSIECDYLAKFMNTITDLIFVQRRTKKYFISGVECLFSLGKEKNEYIWNTFIGKKNIIKESIIFDVSNDVQNVKKILLELIKDN